MSVRYSALPNGRSAPEAQREMEDAFEPDSDDDDNGQESTPLTHQTHDDIGTLDTEATSSIPGAYDFERPYDLPPPGSPPRPSEFALPNDFGNSNGRMPTSPVNVSIPRPSFFRRAVGAILPTHYSRVATEVRPLGYTGGGVENDGVFANVMAKPSRPRTIRSENGDVHIVPEDNQKEAPPSYADAQTDVVPPYWETTIHAPAGLDPGADMIIDDLPSGSVWIFALNAFVSFFFQFFGFLLTYLLHTSHAAKFGSRAGLGITLIQYGFYSRAISHPGNDDGDELLGEGQMTVVGRWTAQNGTEMLTSKDPAPTDAMVALTARDWLSFLLMTLGWFLLLSSIIGFWRVKRWEISIRASSRPAQPLTAEDFQRDVSVRRNIESIFGMGFSPLDEAVHHHNGGATEGEVRMDENGSIIVIPAEELLQEARLARDLRAAGLL